MHLILIDAYYVYMLLNVFFYFPNVLLRKTLGRVIKNLMILHK